MNKLAHQTLEYMTVSLFSIFLVLCAWDVKQAVRPLLPSQAETIKPVSTEFPAVTGFSVAVAESTLFFSSFSIWMGADRVPNVLADSYAIAACDLDENALTDESQDSDDVMLSMDEIGFFSRSMMIQEGLDVYFRVVWRAIPKIPIASSRMVACFSPGYGMNRCIPHTA